MTFVRPLVAVASCVIMVTVSHRVDMHQAAEAMLKTEGTPFKLSVADCVKVALKHNSYDTLIASVLASPDKATADCSKLAYGPCSLVGGGAPYFYPDRNVGDDRIVDKVLHRGAKKKATEGVPRLFKDLKKWVKKQLGVRQFGARLNVNDASYQPPNHNCAQCPAQFNPLSHSCMDQDYEAGGWADPEDKSVISGSISEDPNVKKTAAQWREWKVWKASSCQNNKHKWFFAQRKEMSWCSGSVQVVDGYLKNPAGRTGLTGRGSLGLWGPNKAGDPIIMADGATLNSIILPDSDTLVQAYGNTPFQPTEKYVRLIRRTDVDSVAIPGGMIDPDESGLAAAIREFKEEAMDGEKTVSLSELKEAFESVATLVYRGLVDDPRNTDDAWMETEAYLIDISSTKAMPQNIREKAINGRAGDDAGSVRWLSITDAAKIGKVKWFSQGEEKQLDCCYASHYALIKLASIKLEQSMERSKALETSAMMAARFG